MVSEAKIRAKQGIEDAAKAARAQISDSLEQLQNTPKETLKGITCQMAEADQTWADPQAIKRRLDWGEPAFTIIDVRHPDDFRQERIRGAVSVPEADLSTKVSNLLETEREIFIYGTTDTQMRQSAMTLVGVGYKNVAAIAGGLEGWKEVAGPTEGIAS